MDSTCRGNRPLGAATSDREGHSGALPHLSQPSLATARSRSGSKAATYSPFERRRANDHVAQRDSRCSLPVDIVLREGTFDFGRQAMLKCRGGTSGVFSSSVVLVPITATPVRLGNCSPKLIASAPVLTKLGKTSRGVHHLTVRDGEKVIPTHEEARPPSRSAGRVFHKAQNNVTSDLFSSSSVSTRRDADVLHPLFSS
jgi:hypothetical protein